jgi:hypothetical protein
MILLKVALNTINQNQFTASGRRCQFKDVLGVHSNIPVAQTFIKIKVSKLDFMHVCVGVIYCDSVSVIYGLNLMIDLIYCV